MSTIGRISKSANVVTGDRAGPAELLEDCLNRRKSQGSRKFEAVNLEALTKQYGQCYVTYHRLCVSSTTDDLALLFTRLFGF